MSEENKSCVLYIEPQRVADWHEDMLKSSQSFTPKTYAIRLLYVLFHSKKTFSDETLRIIRETVQDYPELADEVRERFPTIFK